MSRVSDLVQDAELRTRFDSKYTVHIYTETGTTGRERAVRREEHWQRQQCVGGGSYGSVWLERCVQGQGEVELRAVKEVVKSPHASRQIDYNRELEAISKFSHRKYEHCFVKSFGWYENNDKVFIAMEYFKHGDLHHYLYSAPPLPEADAQQITFQVLEGLCFMHENGYSHRDLKPGNILVRSKPPDSWWVKLSDFGISKRAADNLAFSSTRKGTLRYMAPELLENLNDPGEASDARNAQAADMWALGEIAFQMLTKEPTFKSMRRLVTYVQSPETFPAADLRARRVSEEAINFIHGIMQPKPEERQTSSKALLSAWMERCSSQINGKTSSVSIELVASKEMPATPLGESLSTPSGRWSTVSMAAPQSQPSTSVSGTTSREFGTLETTVSFPETSTYTLNSVIGGTARRVHSANQAKYFILKSSNETNIETSAAHGIWCCGETPNSRLSNAYNSTSGPVFLIFSVNKSRKFCGVARMASPWNSSVTTIHWEDGTWKGGFLVEWLSWTSINFDDVSHLRHKEENGIPVTRLGRFVIGLCASTGMEMMRRFGVPELVPRPTQQPNDMSEVGSLGVGRLGLATNTGTNGSNAFESMSDSDSPGPQSDLEIMHLSTSTSQGPVAMEIDDSEDERTRRI